jgi:uncharacterized membrane protein YiaA
MTSTPETRPHFAQPTPAFIGASWGALLLGTGSFLAGLYNATGMDLSLKGLYLTLLMYGLFSAVSLQKSVRDRLEGITVTNLYFGLAWLSVFAVIGLLGASLWNTTVLTLSEKGFYGMAFVLSLFAAVAVQKNVRDVEVGGPQHVAQPVQPIGTEQPMPFIQPNWTHEPPA